MAKGRCFGLKAKNVEQSDAMDALLDAQIDLVVLEGIAGSGKTLLAIAAALEQVLETKMYQEIIFTRTPIAVGEDIGFLPGTEQEKMAPWCGALEDNLRVLLGNSKLTESVIESKIQIKAMQYMRGRSFNKKYVIIDEVQNMTVQQLKVLLTRAGEDCKIVCLGDTEQVDNKKLNTANNALTFLCDISQQVEFIRTIFLPEGVRSRLATWAAETL